MRRHHLDTQRFAGHLRDDVPERKHAAEMVTFALGRLAAKENIKGGELDLLLLPLSANRELAYRLQVPSARVLPFACGPLPRRPAHGPAQRGIAAAPP